MADNKVPLFSDGFDREKFIDADYQLMTREIQSLDKIVYGVVRAKGVADKIFPHIKIPKGKRQHIVATEVEQEAPIFDDNFMKEDLDQVRKSETTFYPVFMHKDFALNMVDIDASRSDPTYYNVDLKALTLRGSVGTMMDYKEKIQWRGYNISGRAHAAANNQGLIDTNSKGIMDTTSVQTFDVGAGVDSNVTAAGDGPASVGLGAQDLVVYHYYGPYDFIMTPGVYAQLIANQNSTTHIHDIERMQSMIDLKGSKLLRNLDVTPYLKGTVETTSTGAVLMFDRKTPAGEPTAVIGEEYPIAHGPTSQNQYGVKGKVIWSGIPCVLRPYAFTMDEAITY